MLGIAQLTSRDDAEIVDLSVTPKMLWLKKLLKVAGLIGVGVCVGLVVNSQFQHLVEAPSASKAITGLDQAIEEIVPAGTNVALSERSSF